MMMGSGVLQHTASVTEVFLRTVQIDDETCFFSAEESPRGVAAAIVPWNMPVVPAMIKLAPALATGTHGRQTDPEEYRQNPFTEVA